MPTRRAVGYSRQWREYTGNSSPGNGGRLPGEIDAAVEYADTAQTGDDAMIARMMGTVTDADRVHRLLERA